MINKILNLVKGIKMNFKLTINGTYRGHFKTMHEAFQYVEKWAKPFRYSWKIEDHFQKIVAQN